MVISCPDCEKKFQVADSVLAGRKTAKLRCSGCQHVWVYQVEQVDENKPLDLDLSSDSKNSTQDLSNDTNEAVEPENPKFVVSQTDKKAVAYQVSSMQKRLVWSLYLAIALLIMIPILVLMRYHIVSVIPQAEVAYEALGLEINTRNEFFSFHDVSFRKLSTESGDKLIIRGKIKYQPPEQEARLVPRVRVTVYGKADCGKQAWWDKKQVGNNHFLERGLCVLDSWTFSTKDNLALPGEVIPFEKEKMYQSEEIMPSEINLQFEKQ